MCVDVYDYTIRGYVVRRQIKLSVPEAEALYGLAASEMRDLASQVRFMVVEELRRRGLLGNGQKGDSAD